MENDFGIYPRATWAQFFHIATVDKKMSLEQAKEFCKEFTSGQAKEAIIKLTDA